VGQKVHPVGMRLGVNRTWKSRWFARKNYAELLKEDLTIRKYVETKLSRAGISDVVIERKADKVVVNVKTARPGIVIGRKGIEVERLNKELEHLTGKDVKINILEVKRIELDAQLVAEHISRQLEQRMGFRRAMKKSSESAMRLGALGIKIRCSGRLGGAEMARVAEHREGRVPLHTLRANIDFARSTAKTTYGTVGVKVWIFKGETLGRQMVGDDVVEPSDRDERREGRDDRGRSGGDDRGRSGGDDRGRGGRGGRGGSGARGGGGGRSGGGARSGARTGTGSRPAGGARSGGGPRPAGGARTGGGPRPAGGSRQGSSGDSRGRRSGGPSGGRPAPRTRKPDTKPSE
jgi:small subunit ribosomal protein S3